MWFRRRTVLNVGGGSRNIALPPQYSDFKVVFLDIDQRFKPDICMDARELKTLRPRSYDAVYCSHNLEHYHRHEVGKVLDGFLHVLKSGGFAHIRVPDVGELINRMVENNMDIEDFLYQAASGDPVKVSDVFYGWQLEIERSGNDFFAHKTGFTEKSLTAALSKAGFSRIYITKGNLEIGAVAWNGLPDREIMDRFKL